MKKKISIISPIYNPVTAGLTYAAMVIILTLFQQSPGQFNDYLAPDNDNAMRLVEIHDWLAGQNWFDMMQYRLGLEGGTLMHWSSVTNDRDRRHDR